MKKIISLILVLVTALSMHTMAFAESTTTLTTTVPDATYTLNVPANQKIDFGKTEVNIGNVTVSDSNGFAVGKNLKVAITYDAFTSTSVNTTIPFEIKNYYFYSMSTNADFNRYKTILSGDAIVFPGQATGKVTETAPYPENTTHKMEAMYVVTKSEDWGKALGGDYTATITFNTEVVAEA